MRNKCLLNFYYMQGWTLGALTFKGTQQYHREKEKLLDKYFQQNIVSTVRGYRIFFQRRDV